MTEYTFICEICGWKYHGRPATCYQCGLNSEIHPITTPAQATPAQATPDGPTWTTEQLQNDFDVIAFAAPLVVVTRKADSVKGSLQFNHRPRLYFDFQPHK